MDVLDLTRLQFAVVTIYHYFFVPLSISLAAVTAGLEITWRRTRRSKYLHLTTFVGKLLMVTFAVGVVTGLVQEFQFGLGWSAFARFYGDVFGPTLAIEGMLAFFLEATFLALWYFGRDRLPAVVHTATIAIVAVGTVLSAFIILAANSFMQNPVAYALDPATGRARLTSFTDLLLNKVNLAAFPHTLSGAAMIGGALLLALGVWRRTADDGFRTLARLGAWLTVAGGASTALTGDHLGKVITQVQPMKMAAAEALYSTTTGAPFSVLALGNLGGGRPFFSIELPRLLSVLAKGSPGATVQGIDDLQAQYTAAYGPGSYVPMIPVAFWSFRLMIGIGMLAMLVAAYYLWSTRKGSATTQAWTDSRRSSATTQAWTDSRRSSATTQAWTDSRRSSATTQAWTDSRRSSATTQAWTDSARSSPHRWLIRWLPLIPVLPAAANTLGWIFTETARQPWLAFGLTKVADGLSPGLTGAEVLTSLLGFTAVYGVLVVVWLRLIRHLARRPLTPPAPAPAAAAPEPAPVY